MRITGAVLEEPGRGRPYGSTRPLTVAGLDLAPPGPGEVLVEIEAAGVCHSDLSVVDGQRPRPTPMLLGHEAAGRVVDAGDGVDDLEAGRRVVLVFLPACGGCAGCRSGGRIPCEPGSAANAAGTLIGGGTRLSRGGRPVLHHLGVSAFATHAVVDRGSVVPVDDDVPAPVAALLGCAVLTGGGAVVNAGAMRSGESVAVVGLGGVGLAAVLVAAAAGASRLVAVDPVEHKRELALRLGATEAMTPDQAAGAGRLADLVVDATGSVPAFEAALAATAPGGRTVTVGLPPPDRQARISPLALVAEARSVIGSYLGSSVPSHDVPMYVDWWRDGRLPVERLATSELSLDDINDAMDALADGQAVRQVIRPS
ncbi:zinc-binding dehydrogenase [Jiangella sp. DSM 45060]|uniref:zinc-binding dehydrogenase n=1 Tax=Jiangella sp. DSM 45060 TaxID=1798224 RepID=UPI00087AD693|nr:zinc-binding dehydrogenase [Jiangella sp. DSM 45060]SDT21792.1 alcohol dehydrogenase [Jiangella sp. DSM 45060]